MHALRALPQKVSTKSRLQTQWVNPDRYRQMQQLPEMPQHLPRKCNKLENRCFLSHPHILTSAHFHIFTSAHQIDLKICKFVDVQMNPHIPTFPYFHIR